MHTLRNTLFILFLSIAFVSGSSFKFYGLDYTARRINYCPSQAQVNQDVQIMNSLAGYVRLYSLVDCNQGVMVMEAIKQLNLPIRVTFGLWLDNYFYAEFPNEYSALVNINNIYGLSKVDSIIVGSETQYRGDFSVDLLISYIGNISTTVKQQMGYPRIQVTTADVIDSYASLPQLIAAVDYIAYNEFAFWENIAINDAVQHTITRYNNFLPNSQGKLVVISEVGWPTQGPVEGNAVPSGTNTNMFFQGIICWAATNNIPLYYFAAFDSLWQQDEDQKYWGLYDENRNLKTGISLNFPCSPSNPYGGSVTQATSPPARSSSSTVAQSSSQASVTSSSGQSTASASQSVSTSNQAASTTAQAASTTSQAAATTSQAAVTAASSTSKAASTASQASTSTTGKAASTAAAASTIGGTTSSQASSSTTGYATCPQCGAAPCCVTASASYCYQPSSYSCIRAGNENKFCGVTSHNGNTYREAVCNGACYDTFCYSCSGNTTLTPTGNC